VTPQARSTETHRRARLWWLTAAALVLIGSGCLILGLQQHQHPLAGPAPSGPPKTAKSAGTAAKVAANLATVRSTPLELTIPAISLSVSLGTLGLNSDGTVQVPTVIQQPGWYRLGPSPGQIGSAVILGHVDSYEGPAVFFKLRSLVAGDAVNVTLADGVAAQFKVTSVATYLKTNFPDETVYTSHGYSALQLVTCGGVFDSQTGHYLSNIVVYTSLVALIPPAGTP
jgi:sortase (surface protein transpeptidase)